MDSSSGALRMHPTTIYKAANVERARQNLARHDWACRVVNRLNAHVALTLDGGASWVERMIPATTPTGVGFTNCAACGANAIHGAYSWDPADPDRLVCTTCGTSYPDARFPEDVAFRAERFGGGQEIRFHGGYRYDFRGFALYSSWSGQIRARKVTFMAGQAQTLATLYAATGEARYAAAAGAILRRFAAVYPGYLVHSSYGEWIDLPPRLVAARINDLPEDEWTIAPNRPDRKLHSGYWNSGRATGSGMEGSFIRQLAVAYDLLHDTLDAAARERIERDLLLESTSLLLADPARNNKSVSNLTAAGLVGMAVGDPSLVRAGADGFWHFVRHWFLPDGTTSESPAYGLMTLNGLWSFGEALHGYSDPPGDVGSPGQPGQPGREVDGVRWEQVDVYGDAAYRAVFQALYDTLLPDLRYPAFADSYVTTTLSTHYAELMVARYDQPAYRALLAELHGGSFTDAGDEYALFNRRPDLALQPGDRVTFGDTFFPALRLGYLRAGPDGRAATAVLSASHWGVHHHRDSLHLSFFQRGHDVLTDLGYLWDRPDKDLNVRTPAHNLVVVDESEQRTAERGGTLHHFDTTSTAAGPDDGLAGGPAGIPNGNPNGHPDRGPDGDAEGSPVGRPAVKVVDCSSEAYAQASLYRRRCILVDHGAAGAYLVDVFRVRGGATHDYLFHGPVPGFTAHDIALSPAAAPAFDPAPYGIANVRIGRAAAPWRLTWALDQDTSFTAWTVPLADETVLIGNGWGERGWGHFNTPDKHVDVPYVIRRRTLSAATTDAAVNPGGTQPLSELESTFVSVFETHGRRPLVTAVCLECLERPAAPGLTEDTTPVLEIARDGGVDVVSLTGDQRPASFLVSVLPPDGRPATTTKQGAAGSTGTTGTTTPSGTTGTTTPSGTASTASAASAAGESRRT